MTPTGRPGEASCARLLARARMEHLSLQEPVRMYRTGDRRGRSTVNRTLLWVLCAAFLVSAPLTAGMQPSPACIQQCGESYEYCRSNDADCYSLGQCYRCDADYNHCTGSCPWVCFEPKSRTKHSETLQPLGTSNTGAQACYYVGYGPPYYHYQTVTTLQKTTVWRVEACNGSVHYETEITNQNAYCWNSTPYTCYNGYGPAPQCSAFP